MVLKSQIQNSLNKLLQNSIIQQIRNLWFFFFFEKKFHFAWLICFFFSLFRTKVIGSNDIGKSVCLSKVKLYRSRTCLIQEMLSLKILPLALVYQSNNLLLDISSRVFYVGHFLVRSHFHKFFVFLLSTKKLFSHPEISLVNKYKHEYLEHNHEQILHLLINKFSH